MGTKVYGTSDDLVELEGDFYGEIGCYGTDDREKGVLLVFSDASILEVKYRKNGDAIWEVKLLKKGSLFSYITLCTNSEAKIYSDIAYFDDGIEWAYACTGEWEAVQ